MEIKSFYHQDTHSFSYLVFDQATKDAVLFDAVLDYESDSCTISYEFAEQIAAYIDQQKLMLHFILESHVHADHLTAAQYFKKRYPNAKTAISDKIKVVQECFSKIFNLAMPCDGSQFDYLIKDKSLLQAGSLALNFIQTPGHTPACVCTLIEDCLFSGDSLFIPDFGTGRCDFPHGSAEDLYDSVHDKLYNLNEDIRVFVGHDYQPGGRELRYETTISESKQFNIQLKESTSKEEFIDFRTQRDKLLNTPKLLLPSIQVNILAGRLPEEEQNGTRYMKLPLSEPPSL